MTLLRSGTSSIRRDLSPRLPLGGRGAFSPVLKKNAPLSRRHSAVSAIFKLPTFGGFNTNDSNRSKKIQKRETVIPEPSYSIPITLVGGACVSHFGFSNEILTGLLGVLGGFLAFQASRVKFVFEDDALEVVVGEKQAETENKFVGGKNRWTYDSFVNWEFWWPGFPVLVYFKETQTKPEGQIHFFPLIFNGKQVYDVMVERCGPSQGSGPSS